MSYIVLAKAEGDQSWEDVCVSVVKDQEEEEKKVAPPIRTISLNHLVEPQICWDREAEVMIMM
jgi:hypothetical protein